MKKHKLQFDSCRDVLIDSIAEQLIKYEEGILDMEGLREELAFLAEHYGASITFIKHAVGDHRGHLHCEAVRLGMRPHVTIIEAGQGEQ